MSTQKRDMEIFADDILEAYRQRIIDSIEPGGSNITVAVSESHLLVVEQTVICSAGYIGFGPAPTPGNEAYIAVDGFAARGSVTKGYIRFVPKPEIKTPTFAPSLNLVNIWLDETYMVQVMSQLNHSRKYLLFGSYNSGHVYGNFYCI